MSPTSFEDLEPHQRRRAAARSALRIAITTTLLIVLYGVIPVPTETGKTAVIKLVVGLLLFVGLIVWQVRSIFRADHPELRAIESLAVTVPVLIIVFAFTYLSLSHSNPSEFSEPLDRIGAMYFTVTVVSTVGFGDIVARTDVTRLLVTVQIVLDLVVIIVIVRTLMYAARMSVRRKRGEPPPELGQG
jgi:hypothetical protein